MCLVHSIHRIYPPLFINTFLILIFILIKSNNLCTVRRRTLSLDRWLDAAARPVVVFLRHFLVWACVCVVRHKCAYVLLYITVPRLFVLTHNSPPLRCAQRYSCGLVAYYLLLMLWMLQCHAIACRVVVPHAVCKYRQILPPAQRILVFMPHKLGKSSVLSSSHSAKMFGRKAKEDEDTVQVNASVFS